MSKLAHKVASIFDPEKPRDGEGKNVVKNSIVETFDNSMKDFMEVKKFENINDIFKEAQKLLERTLKEFEDFNKNIYA